MVQVFEQIGRCKKLFTTRLWMLMKVSANVSNLFGMIIDSQVDQVLPVFVSIRIQCCDTVYEVIRMENMAQEAALTLFDPSADSNELRGAANGHELMAEVTIDSFYFIAPLCNALVIFL